MNKLVLLALFALCAVAAATVHFEEKFGDDYQKNWVVSDWKKSDGTAGTFKHTAGDFFGDAEEDKGLQTGEDARFYAISSKIATPFSNEGKDLVVQFSVKHQQNIDCGGGYIKLLPSSLDQKAFNGDSPYMIMFGPDICGTSTRRVHVIFTYKGKNHLIKKDVKCETDKLTHVYTLIVRPDNTYEVRIDGKKVESGAMSDDWDFLPPKQIQDPAASKPADWVDNAKMADPTDTKPAGYDDIPAKIVDPKATKPDDWDEESDGAWEAPTIDNPEYKGAWTPKMIDNPASKGSWVHPMIANPDFQDDATLYKYSDIGAVGFELWQVKAGTVFDNIIVTDSVAEAEALLDATWGKNHEGEKKMMEKIDADKSAKEEAERKKIEAERKAQEATKASSSSDDDDEDDDDEAAEAIKNKKAEHDEL
jgi:calreticulin